MNNNNKTTIDDIQIFIMTHNRATLISESIESLLNQTAGVKEITILDNESSDNTENVVSHYSSRGVKYLKTYGFLGNFNKAREISNNKYVMLFHDDDILHPEYLEKVLEILNKEKNISAVYSRYTEFRNKNSPKKFEDLKTSVQNGGGYYIFSNSKDFAVFMFFCEVIAYATAVYKTEFFKQIPIEYEKFSKFNDWPFMVKFGEFGKIALLADENAFHVRRHDGQDTWTNINVPSFEQILNWDKFFFDVLFKKKDNFLRRIYSRKATYFYIGKYHAFVPPTEKRNFTENNLRKMAKQNGLFERDANLISRETYDAWLSCFVEKRHKSFEGKNNLFKHLLRLRLRVLKRYLKFDLWRKAEYEKI